MAIKGTKGNKSGATRKSSGSFLQRGKAIFALLGVLGVLVFVGFLTLLQHLYQTQTYYVLKGDVATRTQVTPDMLEPITTQKDTAPKAAKTIADVQTGALFTKYPLSKGDILTNSNVGDLADIGTGVPDNWVITSFNVNADNAVQGRIKRGYYFDMMVTTAKDGSTYPFVNMLALDTSVSLSNASSNNAADTAEAKAGQTSVYVVGLPPQEAGRLQHIMKTHGSDIHLVLSPRQNEYAPPQLASYTGMFSYNTGDAPIDMGKGTDNSFTEVPRDKFGRPISQATTCTQGNAKLSKKDCAAANATSRPNEADQDSSSSSSSSSTNSNNNKTTTKSSASATTTK